MVGFAAFIVILMVGILALVGGLQFISSGHRREPLPPGDTERLERMESAIGALESRLDELQDQQRFLERLVAERPEPRTLRPGADASSTDEDVDSILFEGGEGEAGVDR